LIGQRLKLARTASGLSLRKLQERINNKVSAQAISKYERNEDMPSSTVLIALADALNVSEDYLLGEPNLVLGKPDFRTKARTPVKEKAQIEAKTLHLLERYLSVEELLGLHSIEWHKPREAPYRVISDLSEVEIAAYKLRTHWNLGLDPIPNLTELLEERGIKVLSVELSSNTSGLTAQARSSHQKSIPVIVIKCSDWSERKRFNLAHELGHMVLDVAPALDEEKAAHRFAGAFLMPEEALLDEVGRHRKSISLGEFVYLKKLFKVSIQALTHRCKDLGIIDDSQYRQLFQTFSKKGWRNPPYKEYGALDPELEEPRRFERLCYRALAEGGISKDKAAELLEISVEELNQRLEEPE